jgi:hypothetical protein
MRACLVLLSLCLRWSLVRFVHVVRTGRPAAPSAGG